MSNEPKIKYLMDTRKRIEGAAKRADVIQSYIIMTTLHLSMSKPLSLES